MSSSWLSALALLSSAAAALSSASPASTTALTENSEAPADHYEPYGQLVLGEMRTFYAKHEQDRMLIEQYPHWLTHSTGKTYLEMGALDGQRVSNTKFFYDSGWRGVLVEPQAACREKIAELRPEDTTFSNASCADFMTLTMAQVPGECVGGVGGADFVSEERKADTKGLQDVKVGCSPIGHMLRAAGLTKVDLWSLDVEGAELEVLKGMDWAHIPVHALLIEMLPQNNPNGEAGLAEIRTLLRANGLQFVKKMGTAGWDELWENADWNK